MRRGGEITMEELRKVNLTYRLNTQEINVELISHLDNSRVCEIYRKYKVQDHEQMIQDIKEFIQQPRRTIDEQ